MRAKWVGGGGGWCIFSGPGSDFSFVLVILMPFAVLWIIEQWDQDTSIHLWTVQVKYCYTYTCTVFTWSHFFMSCLSRWGSDDWTLLFYSVIDSYWSPPWSLMHWGETKWWTFCRWLFTRGQFWPSGIVIGCVCGSVCQCVCVNHELVRTITHRLFKLGSPCLDQRCKTPWFRSLLFLGMIDLDLQGQI